MRLANDVWTEEKKEILAQHWGAGKSASEIQKILGPRFTRNSVIGKAHRMKLSSRPSPILRQEVIQDGKRNKAFVWTPELEQLLRKRVAERAGIGDLAYEFGVEVWVIRSKANKLKLQISRQKNKRSKLAYLPFGMPKNAPKKFSPSHKEFVNTPDRSGFMAGPCDGSVSLLVAMSQHCRWQADGKGSDGMPRCCGEKVTYQDYCDKHALVSYPTLRRILRVVT